MLMKKSNKDVLSEGTCFFSVPFALEYKATECHSGFGGLEVSMLASGTQVRGYEPGRNNLQHAFLRKGGKAVGSMSQICGM
jgi:hypothetical protein